MVELQLEDNDYSALLFDFLRTAIAKQAANLKQDDSKEAWLVSQQLDSLFQLISQLPLKCFNEYRAYFIKSFSDDQWASVVGFAEWIGWDALDASEYEPSVYQGRRVISAGEMLINAMCKQILNSSSHSIHRMKEWLPRLQAFSNDQGRKFQYLRYYVAKMMLATNEYRAEEIITYFTPYVRTKGNNPWVWDFLADIYAQAGDDAQSLATLSQAALLGNKEEFKVGIRGKIATVFVKHKRYLEASYEVSVVLATYQRMGWGKGPAQILEMCRMPWYQEPEKGYSNNALYKQYATLIDPSLLPQKKTTGKKQVFVLTDHNPQKQIYHFTSEGQVRGHFKYTTPLELGGVYSGHFQPPKKVGGFVKMENIKPLDATQYPQLACRVKGKFRLLTGGFGFINKYYVTAPLVQKEKLEDGEVYDALCVLSYERKKERFTMVVCKILRQ